jgi:NitT/TauT family transport system ATP-binding protein
MGDRAVIMAGSPGNIVHEMDIDLPDPRDRTDPAVQALRTRLMATFQEAANYKKPESATLAAGR